MDLSTNPENYINRSSKGYTPAGHLYPEIL